MMVSFLLELRLTTLFKSQLTFAIFAAVNRLSGPLRKQKFTYKGSKDRGLRSVIGAFRSVLCVSVF